VTLLFGRKEKLPVAQRRQRCSGRMHLFAHHPTAVGSRALLEAAAGAAPILPQALAGRPPQQDIELEMTRIEEAEAAEGEGGGNRSRGRRA
jgi:hypothetical protein